MAPGKNVVVVSEGEQTRSEVKLVFCCICVWQEDFLLAEALKVVFRKCVSWRHAAYLCVSGVLGGGDVCASSDK